MEVEFWKQRWQKNQIGFHLDAINPNLKQLWSQLKLAPGSHVLVPLCGKSLDMLWLQQAGYSVTGVECSQLAVDAFFAEQKIIPEHKSLDDFQVYQSGNFQLLAGDFFKLQSKQLQDIAAVYDRAALIALPADMRKAYAEKLIDSLPTTAVILLVTLEYDQQVMQGPPFSVSAAEVQRLYGQRYAIHTLRQENIIAEEPRFAQRGLGSLIESAYLLQTRTRDEDGAHDGGHQRGAGREAKVCRVLPRR